MAGKSLHIPYGLVMLPEGKMSSREGTMVLFDDLKEKIFSAAEKATKEKHKELSKKEVEERSKKIGYAALKFSMINRDNNKDVVFDWETALDFEGETGPYLQYAYARINSILDKYGKKINSEANTSLLKEKEEIELIKMLGNFNDIVKKAGEDYRINTITRYLLDLAQLFNNFYHIHPVLKAEEELMKSRLLLIKCVQQVIKNGLYLLGIDVLEQM
jgi:arginyl-tRNA synthetase